MFTVSESSLEKYGIQSKCLHDAPQVRLFANVLTKEESDHIIRCGEYNLNRAKVAHASGETGVYHTRTNRNCWLTNDLDPVVESVTGKIAEILALNLDDAESLQLIHYKKGEQFEEHHDAFVNNEAKNDYGVKTLGQRLTTALIYLNDVSEGGHTWFPKLHIKVRPKAGFMIAFENCKTDLITAHPYSLHSAMPVLKGEKWACNLWFRGKPGSR